MAEFDSFAAFWPFYLSEHSVPLNRTLHVTGTLGGGLVVLGALVAGLPLLALAGIVGAYGFAWVGHFFVEHNRPASFRHPWWSFLGDWKMVALVLSGRLDAELARVANEH